MRQGCDFRRHAALAQGPRDMRFPDASAHQAFAKAVGLAQLEADSVHGFLEYRDVGVGAEGIEYPALIGIQILRVAGGETREQVPEAFLFAVDDARAFAWRRVVIEVQHFVHHAQIPVVVQQALVSGDLGVNANPELYVARQFRRSLELARGLRGEGRQRE